VSPHFRIGRSLIDVGSAFRADRWLVNFSQRFECDFHSQSFNLPFNRPNRCRRYGLGLKMIRTVWLATICLVVLSALPIGKALTPADPKAAERLADEATVGSDLAQDALSKADRLEITYVRQDVPARSALQPTEPIVPAVSSVPRPVETKIVSRHWHDPNAISSPPAKAKQAKQAGTNKSKTVDRKGGQAADRSKPTEPMKPCSRPGAFGNILRSLKLSPACDS